MPTPTMLFTVLPKAFTGDGYEFSVFVSPRLDAASTSLSAYLGNWPNIVAQMAASGKFWVQRELPTNPLVPAGIDVSQLQPALWDLIFPPATLVKPFAFKDPTSRPMFSFSVAAIEKYLETLYAQVGNASPTNFPDLKTGPLRTFANGMLAARPVIERALKKDVGQQPGRGPHPDAQTESELAALASNLGVNPPPLAEFYRALRFYTRGNQESWSALGFKSQLEPVVAAKVPPPLQPPTFDFHQVIAILGDHPYLLRALGLVLDCKVLTTDLGAALGGLGRVRVQLQWGPPYPAPKDKSPWTRYLNNPTNGFTAEPRKGSDIQSGLLRLADMKRFSVFQTDVDGNALKSLGFGMNMADRLVHLLAIPPGESAPWIPVAQPAPEALPAQRNGGLTVTLNGRDQTLFGGFQNQVALNGVLDSGDVYYDEIARGYRVDVLFKGNWFSLCARQGTYDVAGTLVTPPGPDEGYVKAGTASSDPKNKPKPGNPMYLHEALFGWDNWSLAAPRPGKSISFERDDVARTQQLKIEKVEPAAPPEFDVTPNFAVVPGTLPKLRFGEAYAFRARVVDLGGNSLKASPAAFPGTFWQSVSLRYLRYEPVPPPVWVLRQAVTPGESVEHLVIRTKAGPSVIPDAATIFNNDCRRFVAPPKTSQMLAELHGEFDKYFAPTPNPDAAYAIALKEEGSFNDPGPATKLIDTTGAVIPFPVDYARGDPLPSEPKATYTIHTGGSLMLPYLPDPLAVGVALHGFPGTTAPIVRSFTGAATWPNYRPFVFTLGKNAGPDPVLSPLPDFTSITLPPATILELKYSSLLDTAGIDLMARFHSLSAAMQATVQARSNQHWMTSPSRVLKLVHAVERPLQPPTINKFLTARGAGETFITIQRSLYLCHSHSTGQIGLFGRWADKVDYLHEDGPRDEPREGQAFEVKVGYDESSVNFGQGLPNSPNPRHEFGDTKHRWVQYTGIGTTRFREYFPPAITKNPDLITYEGPIYESKPGVPYVNVLSSARPDVPKISYVVPTFRWVESNGGKTRKRVGRGLRIYFERPWFSSGEGELLGVVIQRPSADPAVTDLKQFISQWGADPMYTSSGPTAPIAVTHFVAEPEAPEFAPVSGTNLKLAEREDSDVRVDVVGFTPHYENGHYFVDLVMNPGNAYQPFVRFALARYQPNSLSGLHLSRIVRTEFAQLVADRTATVTRIGTSEFQITVSGPSARNQLGSGLPVPIPNFPPLPSDPTIIRANPVVLPVRSMLVKDDYAGAGRLLRVHYERLDNPASEDFGWVKLQGEYILDSYTAQTSPGIVTWQGKTPVPPGFGTDGKRYRVVIREEEYLETDPEVAETVPVYNPEQIPMKLRLLYADQFELVP